MKRTITDKLLPLTIILCLVAMFSQACIYTGHGIKGNGKLIWQTRNVGDFSKLSIGSAFKVYIKQGSATELKIEAEENLMAHISTKVSGGTLEISSDGISATKSMTIYLTYVNVDDIRLSGAVCMESASALNFENIAFDFSGASEADLDLTAKEMTGDVSGASHVKLAGKVQKVHFNISGAADFEGMKLDVATFELEASGAAKAEVSATDELNISASGAASVRYSGNARVTQDSSGAASISKRD